MFTRRIMEFARNRCIPRAFFLVLISTTIGGCSGSLLDPAGPVANGEQLILLDALGIMLVIVIPTVLTTLWFAWWFRASNNAALYRPTWVYSDKLEVVVWTIPGLTVLFLGGLAWIGSHKLDPARPLDPARAPLEVQVVSLDWKWLFIYPEQHIATVNRLVLPVGRPVHLRLTSSSVMNVFFVPRLAGEIYTMNGMVTQLNLRADKVGTYPGLSAQFSGDGFSSMGFMAEIISLTDFNQFVGNTRASPGKLDENAYRAISKPSQAAPMQVFGNVSDGLFENVATRRLPAADGPSSATLAYGAVGGGH